jgi:hypothetical protein
LELGVVAAPAGGPIVVVIVGQTIIHGTWRAKEGVRSGMAMISTHPTFPGPSPYIQVHHTHGGHQSELLEEEGRE